MRVELVAHLPFSESVIAMAGKLTRGKHVNMFFEDKGEFIKRLIKLDHTSLVEFGYAVFYVEGVSRVLLSQLSRHRLISLAVESQRHAKAGKGFIIPPTVQQKKELLEKWEEILKRSYELYEEALKEKIPLEDARYILPQSVTTSFFVGANFREWRHILKLRLHKSTQWEFREFCKKVVKILKRIAPSVFYDFEEGEDSEQKIEATRKE